MVDMNPYYAHNSPVGQVFNVATWSPWKLFGFGLVSLLFAAIAGLATACFWNPELFAKYAPEVADRLERENRMLAKEYPYSVEAITFSMGAVAYLMLASGLTGVTNGLRRDCYFRAGPGGLSLRVPGGVSLAKLGLGSSLLKLNLPWSEVDRWTFVQRKSFGARSTGSGNSGAQLEIRTRGGRKYRFALDGFRELPRVIHTRMQDAQTMMPAVFTGSLPKSEPKGRHTEDKVQTVTGEQKQEAIVEALRGLLQRGGHGAGVQFSGGSSRRYVQFIQLNGDLMFDLPLQALRGDEKDTARKFFRQLGKRGGEEGDENRGGVAVAAVATRRSFQVNLAQDVEQAADLTLEVFDRVFGLPESFEMAVEKF